MRRLTTGSPNKKVASLYSHSGSFKVATGRSVKDNRRWPTETGAAANSYIPSWMFCLGRPVGDAPEIHTTQCSDERRYETLCIHGAAVGLRKHTAFSTSYD